MNQFILRNLKLAPYIAATWVAFFSLNYLITQIAPYKSHIALIFLPAGIKIVFACIHGKEAFFGLLIGSLITGYLFLEDVAQTHILAFAFMSALTPIFSVYLIDKFLPLGIKLSLLTFNKVILIALTYALICSFFHNTFLLALNEINFYQYQQDSIAMFIGDMTGSLIFLGLLSYFRELAFNLTEKYL